MASVRPCFARYGRRHLSQVSGSRLQISPPSCQLLPFQGLPLTLATMLSLFARKSDKLIFAMLPGT